MTDLTPEKIDEVLDVTEEQCPECIGFGYRVVAGCCHRPTRTGDCCGTPEPQQHQCMQCGGCGKIEIKAMRDQLIKEVEQG